MVKVSVLLPLLQALAVASHGVTLAFCSVLTNISGSYTGPREKEMYERLNGLKSQVHVPPLSVSIVTPPWGPAAFPDDWPDEPLLPQAAASRTDAMTTPISFRRLIAVALR